MKNNILLDKVIDYTRVEMRYKQEVNQEIRDWLDEYAGAGHYALGGWAVYFEKEEDATMFALRWG